MLLQDKTIVLGVTGSVAAYKAADIASKLTRAGARVDAVLTDSATRFISPLTLQGLTRRPVSTSLWESAASSRAKHIALAQAADIIVIAPATANTIAHLAGGLADDLLTCTVLATRAPVVVAPAMNDNMFTNPATQENIEKLRARGFIFVEPGHGRLACGLTGVGRLADVDTIIGTVRQVLGKSGDLVGKRLIVTAGGTREPLDPVRYLSNHSSGKMGYALAATARDRGAQVGLITTIGCLPETVGMDVAEVDTAEEMAKAVTDAVTDADALIMAAAVADYKPEVVADSKIKKNEGCLDIKLVKTSDILTEAKGSFVKVGFAAESEDPVENAKKKLQAKGLDLIVANDITAEGSGFDSDDNKVWIIDKDGQVEDLPLLSKAEVADKILDRVVELLG